MGFENYAPAKDVPKKQEYIKINKPKYIKISMREKLKANKILKSNLETRANKYNEVFTKHFPNEEVLVLPDGSINSKAFPDINTIPKNSDTNNDEKILSVEDNKIREQELEWSGLDNPKVQSFYKSEYNCKNLNEMLAKYCEKKETENGIMLEKVMTTLLARFLGENYIVLRTATYDDYFNGVDNIIINKTTGETICAFDDLNEEFDNKHRDKKFKKVKNKTARGGAKIKYGLSIKDGVLEKKTLKNLPIFYLSLTKAELKLLMNNLNPDLDSPVTNEEENIVHKIFRSFKEQAEYLLNEGIAKGKIAENIKTSLETIETLVK